MKENVGNFLIGIIWLGMILLLVRPGSQGPTLVGNVSNGLIGLVGAGTGGGTWASG